MVSMTSCGANGVMFAWEQVLAQCDVINKCRIQFKNICIGKNEIK